MDANVAQMAPLTTTGVAPAGNPQALHQPMRLHFFNLPAEIRNKIYEEALITPIPNVVRSFVPPALLQTNSYIRQETLPMYYAQNHFELTVKRAPQHQVLYTHLRMPNVDKYAWERFFTMWRQFSSTGSDVLKYITRITLIYQLSMDTGFGFGEDAYDKRIGLRFLSGTREEDQDATYGEPGFEETNGEEIDSDSCSDADSNDSDEEFRELDHDDKMDLDNDQAELNEEDNEQVTNPVSMIPINSSTSPDIDVLGVYELVTAGNFTWPSRSATYALLYEKVNAYESNNLWKVYPCQRLADMLWRCAQDCPLATHSVDFLCEDYQHWMDRDRPYRAFDSETLYDPDNEEDEEED